MAGPSACDAACEPGPQGRFEELAGQLGPGRLAPSAMTAGQGLGTGPEGATSWDLPPSWDRDLGGESHASGPCPFLSEQRIMSVW